MEKIIKLSRAAAAVAANAQYLAIPAASAPPLPNGPFTVLFMHDFCGLATGDNPQYMLSTGPYGSVAGAVNIVQQTSGAANGLGGKVCTYLDASSSALVSADTFTDGPYIFALRRDDNNVLSLRACPILSTSPVDGAAVREQFATPCTRGFSNPSGILLGARAGLATNRFSDQAFGRAAYVSFALTDLEISKVAYGMPIEKLGYTPGWRKGDGLDDLGDFTLHGAPTEIDGPGYGYTGWGTYLKPFSKNSLWNSRPVNPVFGDFVIPACYNPRGSTKKIYPSISTGKFSSGVFLASPSDPVVTVFKREDEEGLFVSDEDKKYASIQVGPFPAAAIGALGNDGHCDIVDEQAGIIHSFWILEKDSTGKRMAQQYGWSKLDGTGFPDPSHYYQGARATGVPTSAGMIRIHEVDDGEPMFHHALACSLDWSGLASSPEYVYPAARADGTAYANWGKIPEGALIMLPSSYDTARCDAWPLLKKVAETLKVHGARAVDRNDYTPYGIYVENGATWKMTTVTPWDNALAAELEYIRTQMRQVVSQDGWINGDGEPRPEDEPYNMIALRGPWVNANGAKGPLGVYNWYTRGLDFPVSTASSSQSSGANMNKVDWAHAETGAIYKLEVFGTGAAKLKFQISITVGEDEVVKHISANCGVGESSTLIPWPEGGWGKLGANKVAGPASSIWATLTKVG